MRYDVSVIIPVYNREKYISNCLKSVVNQTYEDIEIIVVDDGSTDNTKSIIEQYICKYKNIKYIYKDNGGVSSARNLGIQTAQGKYISFLDSDDEWNPLFIEKGISKLYSTGEKICYCGMNIRNTVTGTIRRKKIRFNYDTLNEMLRGYLEAQTITWIIERDILINNNIFFDETISYAEDLEFFLKILSISKATFVNEYLAYYNMHSNSLTNNIDNQLVVVKVLEDYIKWLVNTKSIICNISEVEKIIYGYRIPANILRTFYDSIDKYNFDFINKNKQYKRYIKKLNVFIGSDKFTIMLYKISVYNKHFYNLINCVRNIKNKYKKHFNLIK